jgi:TonB family protein
MTDAATFDDSNSLGPREPMRGAFIAALTVHGLIIGALALSAWLGRTENWGGKTAGGGAVAIQTVASIQLQHRGLENPVANDSQSEVPQIEPTKQVDRAKQEIPKPDAIALRTKTKPKEAPVESQHHIYKSFRELAPNQQKSSIPQQVSNQMYSATPGAGQVGGMNTTLGARFSGYAAQVRDIVARNWRTNDVNPNLQTAPPVIATFDLMRDGSVRNVQIVQRSGTPALDASVLRAIQDSQLPPFPPELDKNSAKVEFTFELKR